MQHTQLMKSIVSNCSHTITTAQPGHDQHTELQCRPGPHYSMQNAKYSFSFQNLTKLITSWMPCELPPIASNL